MTTTNIQPSQIEILDYETTPKGNHQHIKAKENAAYRWQYTFPFWVDYAIENEETAHPLRCDFADVCNWAIDKALIEDYSTEPQWGMVLIPGTCEARWSPEKQDAVETYRGRYYMTFEQFLREYLTEKDLCEFVASQIEKQIETV